jgi:hypothetical protein
LKKPPIVAIVLLLGFAALGVAYGQEIFGLRRRSQVEIAENQPYDGRVTFARIRFNIAMNGFCRRGSFGEPPWAHDYPTADTHVMKIVNELTLLRPHVEVSNVFTLADPELHNYPIAYLSEPGCWIMDEDEMTGLRTYLQKGGFIIFDDFRGQDWYNLEHQMRNVLPDGRWVQLDARHPIFHSFFEINDLKYLTSYNEDMPTYYGMFEDNDPAKRLMAIANRDNDLGEYWEFSDTGYAPVDLSNEAYKFGVNYFIYALTH